MRRVSFVLTSLAAIVLGTCLSISAQSKINFRDFSGKGADYSRLSGLRFASNDVTYLGEGSIEFAGKTYAASKYSLTAVITVQTLSAPEVYEKVPAKFEIQIADDKDDTARNEIVKQIFDIWSKKEIYSGEYFFDFISNDTAYAFTATPDLVNVKGYYYIWLDGRLIKIVFRGLVKESGGWGVMDSFTRENIRLEIDGKLFRPYSFPLGVRKSFLKDFKSGRFGRSI